jgi:acyl-CoA synthetase (AMP-forming)/AMP-acid ligase II
VVVAVPDELIGNTLIAFVVPNAQGTLSVEELLAHCKSRLPHYMVPGRIEVRPGLPLTATGKIDRNALRQDAAPRG